ncbi:hypothetical protein [Dyadobacter sp. NIV53]|uniref:hypothetical protein n=1 Tax=Dyadobacter sp. NIV53 TaxID=2861765 RepID=UPI001E5813BF|nr:hypothetical protein [Dyadobacter sp. NIV53]
MKTLALIFIGTSLFFSCSEKAKEEDSAQVEANLEKEKKPFMLQSRTKQNPFLTGIIMVGNQVMHKLIMLFRHGVTGMALLIQM